jgi:predicted alpha/beta-hydrolase family hydrolase
VVLEAFKWTRAARAAYDEARGASNWRGMHTHVALQQAVSAVVCLGYPLCGGGDCTKLRDKVLRELSTPILFVQGTRDSLCPLEVLARVRREMRTSNELHVVEGGDHSLLVTKTQLLASGETQVDVDLRSVAVIRKFFVHHRGVAQS